MLSHQFFSTINWQAPWLSHIAVTGLSILQADNWRQALNDAALKRAISNSVGLPIQFVAQSDLPNGVAYEEHIFKTGCVPTRDNLHDFFNALIWLTYPRIKVQLNTLQAAQIYLMKIQRCL